MESEQAEAGPEQTAPEEDFLETNAMKDSFRDLDEANLEIGQQVFASAPKTYAKLVERKVIAQACEPSKISNMDYV